MRNSCDVPPHSCVADWTAVMGLLLWLPVKVGLVEYNAEGALLDPEVKATIECNGYAKI